MIKVFEKLKSMGKLEYGSVLEGDLLRSVAGIILPDVGTRDEFRDASLAELSVSDFIRGRLISEGKYFASVRGNYRVLSPSENSEQVKKYMKSADSKLKRAIRLHDNTPKEFKEDRERVRIHRRRESIAKQKSDRDNLLTDG